VKGPTTVEKGHGAVPMNRPVDCYLLQAGELHPLR
jgi:hypothetical protein